VSYPGTCPENPGDVAWVARGSLATYVYLNDGSPPDVFLHSEWIEGPYTGGAWVMKQSGEHIPRFLNAFTDDFRGTEEQRAEQETWLQYAFDTEKFLTRQYFLAPNFGSGDANGVGATYPTFRDEAAPAGNKNRAAGTIIKTHPFGQDVHQYNENFVMASAFVKAQSLRSSATIEFVDGAFAGSQRILKTVTIEPGNFSKIIIFEDAPSPSPLIVRWKTSAQFQDAGGFVHVEATELLRYKPELHDLYLCLRLGSCRLNLHHGLDGSGPTEDNANVISDSYFENGCVTNVHGVSGPAGTFAEINSNAVFDAARRLSKSVRVVPRQNFIGYELDAQGRSVCYFLRRTIGDADIFDGIGPNRLRISTGAIRADRRYMVRSGVVTYRGTNYVAGQVFTGVHGAGEFQGDGHVYEYDGIRHTPEREGETNEWLMGHQFKVYHPSDSSIWKPDAYSDYWFLSERCLFGYNNLPEDLEMQYQGTLDSLIFAPEAPTGWRYAKNTNTFGCSEGDTACEERRINRYKSCRIYEPDPEIESATVLMEGGDEVVKLVFKTRFHHCETAVGSIARDVSTWNIFALKAEPYRTMENGLREYLVWAHTGHPLHDRPARDRRRRSRRRALVRCEARRDQPGDLPRDRSRAEAARQSARRRTAPARDPCVPPARGPRRRHRGDDEEAAGEQGREPGPGGRHSELGRHEGHRAPPPRQRMDARARAARPVRRHALGQHRPRAGPRFLHPRRHVPARSGRPAHRRDRRRRAAGRAEGAD
jgi:hypothetical protein